MDKVQKQRVSAKPPWKYSWIEDFDDMERLGVIYAKMAAITDHFSGYSPERKLRQESADNVYGYWFIFRDICDELADILKLKKWFEEAEQQKA
jgi:hypothetical protein